MRFTIPDALARIPGPIGERSVTVFERGTLTLKVYAPRGVDPQTPHTRDELYVVVQGRGTFVREGSRIAFGPGDCLFAAAGDEHRFVDFSDDLVVWVIFYGVQGGEVPRAGAAT
jgi:mannose-6-phosphate isomerase-like protein (cupin superfamily)